LAFLKDLAVAGVTGGISPCTRLLLSTNYRDEKFYLMDEQTKIKKGDEVVVVTHVDNLSELNKRWDGTQTNGG
jgi:Trk K+ transport system NAD-binding subunit